jgi:FAD/FMN-containing dehydrogenase
VQAFVERSAEVGLAEEAIFSRDGNSEATMWALREAIPTCLMDMSRQHEPECAAKLFKYDVSLPQASQMPLVMQIVSDQLISEGHEVVDSASGYQDDSLVSFKICGFGHVGDGNLHLNILMRYIYFMFLMFNVFSILSHMH